MEFATKLINLPRLWKFTRTWFAWFATFCNSAGLRTGQTYKGLSLSFSGFGSVTYCFATTESCSSDYDIILSNILLPYNTEEHTFYCFDYVHKKLRFVVLDSWINSVARSHKRNTELIDKGWFLTLFHMSTVVRVQG